MKLILILLLTFTFLFSFDTRTHVFIAQEIIKDLEDDGKLTIKPFGTFTPPTEVKNAILNYKSTYRMGSIGPDGFPDIASGQVTVHGGVENGFKTDDWLKWVISHAKEEKEIAFAYGYLAHASADVFAHTYVNMYTGDVFDAGSAHEDVELRHIYLETFISNFMPPLTNAKGEEIGKPHEVVAVSEALPIDYILDTLLLNDTVMNEYKKTEAIYLYYMYDVRNKILKLDEYINPQDGIYAKEVNKLLLDKAKLEVEKEVVNEICDESIWDIIIDKSYDEIVACKREEQIDAEIDVINDRLDVLENLGAVLPTFTFAKLWVARIEHASREYLKAASRVSQDFLRHDGDSFETMSAWLECYAQTFTSLGVVISEDAGSCLAYDPSSTSQQKPSFGVSVDFDLDASLSLADLGDKYDTVKESIADIEGSLASKMIALVTASNKSLIEARDRHVDDALLNQQFSQDSTDKHLLKINDIAQRVKLEMQLRNGYLDIEKFSPIANAITLTKLTLLGADGINALLEKAGATPLYSNNFSNEGKSYFNILFNSLKTLDANHQWLEKSPPMPRESGYEDTQERKNGYTNGFKIFKNETSRLKVFQKIFIGPLNIGLHKPEMILKNPLLDENYPYIPCISHPFPNGEEDKTCLEINEEPVIIITPDENISQEEFFSTETLTNFIGYIIQKIESLVVRIVSTILDSKTVSNDGVTHLKSATIQSTKGYTSTALSEIDSHATTKAWMIVEDNQSEATMLTMPTIPNTKSINYHQRKDNSIDIKIITDVPNSGIQF